MKQKFYLLLILVAPAVTTQAQIKQGAVFLGGGVNISNQSAKEPEVVAVNGYTNDVLNLTLSPSIGKAIRDNLVLGVTLSYNYGHTSYTSTTNEYKTDQSTYGVGVYLREYQPIFKRFYLYEQEQLSLEYVPKQGGDDLTSYSLNLGFTPGIAYAISKHFQIETGLTNLFAATYSHSKDETSIGNTTTSSFSLASNLSQAFSNLTVGCQFVFGN